MSKSWAISPTERGSSRTSRSIACRPGADLLGIACSFVFVITATIYAIIMVVGPITGASLNPARAFGPELVSAFGNGKTFWNQLVPVYVLPGLIGSGIAALAYDWLASPRLVVMPIAEAVTHPDQATS